MAHTGRHGETKRWRRGGGSCTLRGGKTRGKAVDKKEEEEKTLQHWQVQDGSRGVRAHTRTHTRAHAHAHIRSADNLDRVPRVQGSALPTAPSVSAPSRLRGGGGEGRRALHTQGSRNTKAGSWGRGKVCRRSTGCEPSPCSRNSWHKPCASRGTSNGAHGCALPMPSHGGSGGTRRQRRSTLSSVTCQGLLVQGPE